ncbi:hypothetical protein Prudu_016411 [Prunus dulcis]|uniref:Reverse transcriptase zinc-binding domain-containing protein n=1 Tax=Prunus dulcis TaxID=3755 RepID=A0A4Y1RL67_PRUDU|nr:hypothetical protein Prudu_016411 [Prunus dulcis]
MADFGGDRMMTDGTRFIGKSEHLCLSKSDGGMGFRDIETFNLAVLAKQCWRLWSNPDAVWARVLLLGFLELGLKVPPCLFFSPDKELPLEGSRVKGVWFGAPLSYKPEIQRISKFDVWLLALSSNSAIHNHVRKEVLASVSIICWEIWKERCNAFLLTFPSRSWYCAQEIKILPYLGRWIQNLPAFGLKQDPIIISAFTSPQKSLVVITFGINNAIRQREENPTNAKLDKSIKT